MGPARAKKCWSSSGAIVSDRQPTKGTVNIRDLVGVSGGQPTKGAVNIGDIVSGGQPTKGAVNIGYLVGVSVG